ncbi:MAG: hypothetical protein A2W27_08900 [Deltaproteobacteria bacterium RBG_16_44_11]|nr:MAG: hypothetical protein A2W27_08900 [Deltaproteobacteria bacterium RBG_16_44_11]
MNKSLTLRLLLLLLLIGLGIYLFIHFDLYLFFKDKGKLIDFIRSSPYDVIIFIMLQIVQVVAAPIPGELSGLIGGYLYGPFWGTIYSTIGLTLGSWLAFLLAHFFGMPLLEKIVKPQTVEKFDHFIEHKGILVFFLFFLIPGFPKDYLCYIMGVSRIPVWTFIAVSTAGRLFGTTMLSITGSVARNEQYLFLAVMVAVGAVIFILAYYYHDKLLEILKKKKK